MAENGAIYSLPCVPAKVGLPKREQLFSVVGGNAYSCPRLWENAWDEAADALRFPARQLDVG